MSPRMIQFDPHDQRRRMGSTVIMPGDRYVLTALACGLTINQVVARTGWSRSKVLRTRAALLRIQRESNLIYLIVKLIADGKFDMSWASYYGENVASRLMAVKESLTTYPLSEKQLGIVAAGIWEYPTIEPSWASINAVEPIVSIRKQAGLAAGDVEQPFSLIACTLAQLGLLTPDMIEHPSSANDPSKVYELADGVRVQIWAHPGVKVCGVINDETIDWPNPI